MAAALILALVGCDNNTKERLSQSDLKRKRHGPRLANGQQMKTEGKSSIQALKCNMGWVSSKYPANESSRRL